MLKVAPCTVVRSYNQIFSAWWVTTILYSYGATLCELRYYDRALAIRTRELRPEHIDVATTNSNLSFVYVMSNALE